jgi:ribosome recycling factor
VNADLAPINERKPRYIMINPFDIIVQKLEEIQRDIAELKAGLKQKTQNHPEVEIITEEQLLQLLKICRSTSIKYRSLGMPYIRQGARIFYFKDEVYNWMRTKKRWD